MALRAAQARRIAAATAFGGGGLTLLAASTVALLYLQARIAARAIGITPWKRPRVDGVYGVGGGEPLTLVMMGDSTAAGFAVDDPRQTPPVQIASGLSAAADRPVRLRDVSRVGATSRGLAAQLERVRGQRVDLAVVLIGANDVIGRIRPADAAAHLREVVRELVASGAAVVVATCPDLGTVQPIPQPLRAVARRASRQMAAAQTVAVVEEGGSTVALGDLLAEEFLRYPDEMFGPDRFHPSARGYARAATVVLPALCAALGLLPEPVEPQPEQAEVLPVDRAAAAAVEQPGSEVRQAGAADGRGPRGLWARLLRRGTAPAGDDSTSETDSNSVKVAPGASDRSRVG
ncbi:SGNH/GDSL hydrolase family protein [Thermobifida cellulosilytica]|uniref:G-D-S-L family lipolytic protein n=1 Tax=Thermobifida cellulosilytica TB100 TaxID=665004 RepID=A0A147KF67_THECS|nr:SGNH/GDSL hydrolase family protein [Thermobifida cellulosilytica]KUP95908.1 G-D-S-L family lipolytic protein [Thermobifida cellulosilytica TB100]